MNNKNIKKNFDFLIKYGWFLHNSSLFSYETFFNTKNKYKRCEHLPIYNILLSDKLYIFDKTYQKFLKYNILGINQNIDSNLYEPLEYKIYNNIKSNISFLETTTNNKKQLEILNEYAKLLKGHEFEIKKFYSELTDECNWTREAKLDIVRREPGCIDFFTNPSFSIEKEAYISYQKKNICICSNADAEISSYFNRKYKKILEYALKKFPNKDINYIYLKMMKISPITSAEIVKRDISKEVLNEALKIFPELLFYGKIKNQEHLYLNPLVYKIINSNINNYNEHVDIITNIIKNNIKLIDKQRGSYNDLQFCSHASKKLIKKY